MSQVDHGELVVEVLTWVEISKFYGAFVLNRRVDSTAPSTRRLLNGARRDAGSSPLDARRNQRGHAIAEK
jgi:hypothetical protein